jgi:hypothetical protein
MSNLATIVNNILADSGIDDINVVVTTGSYSNPAWITALSWSKISGTPTTLSGYGITDAVPAIRTITINGTAQDLSVNRSWSVGTVTSVGLSVPTGFSIANSPVTSSGTLALTFAAGYSLPTTASQTNWNTAYNDSITAASVTGTTTKTLTLTQQDGGTITASWTDYDTAPVTSVNAGTGISVNQTTGAVTVTNTGTLTVAGTTNQVLVNGGTAAANGNITLSLPQSIGTSNTPTFGGLIVSGTETRQINLVLPASYNGTGYSNLIERINFPWYSEYWDIGVKRSGGVAISSMEFWLNGSTKMFELTTTSGLGYLGGNTILTSANYNTYSPTLTGGGASGTWGISITGTAASETLATVVGRGNSTLGNRPITLDNGGGAITTKASAGGWAMGSYYLGSSGTYLAGFGAFGTNDSLSYAWIGSAYNSAWMTISPSSTTFNTTATINGQLNVVSGRVLIETGGSNTYGIVSGYNNNNHLMTMRASISGSTSSPTLTAVHQMTFVEYAEANDTTGWYFKSSQPGTYTEIARITRSGINWNGNTVLHSGNYNSYAPTLTGGGASGTWSINITGSAGSAGSVAWSNVSSKPANWLNEPNLVYDNEPNNAIPSGFWQSYLGSGNPTGTWFNYINVRHSNTGNVHGFQLGMSYYDNNLWFRSYQGSGTYQSWALALSTQNYNSYAPTLTGGGASGTWGINITGSASSATTATTATTASNSNALNGISVTQIFNNMGQSHGTYTDFNSVGNFGVRYLQGDTNGPNTGASQYYGFTLGLGDQYPYSGAGSYGSQFYWNRTATGGNPYVSVRFNEGGTWGAWSKIYAGYADSAGIASTASSANSLTFGGGTVMNNSAWAGGGGYHGYTYSGANWRFGFSSTSGVVDVYADGNFYATDSSYLVLHTGNSPYAYNMNQYVRTTDSVGFSAVSANTFYNGRYTYWNCGVAYASGATPQRFEVGRIGIDFNDWNGVGTFEVEIQETYYFAGGRKRYVISYGYGGPVIACNLVELNGVGSFGNYRVVVGSEVVVSGDWRYIPVYVDVQYYSQVAVQVRTTRNITNSTVPEVGYAKVFTSPAITTIAGFSTSDIVYPTSQQADISNPTYYATNYFNVNTGRAAAENGYAALFVNSQYASSNHVPFSFESTYGTHSWGVVARFRINQSGADRPSIQFSSGSSENRWNVGYNSGSDDHFRITKNMGIRNDGSNDGWGTEYFRINTDGSTYLGIQGQIVYFNGAESANLYGIRGRFTNEYIHLYNKVGIGNPNGWGVGESSTPVYGLSTYGAINVGYGYTANSTFNNGKVLILSDSGSYGQFQINSSNTSTEASIVFGSGGSGVNSGQYTYGGVVGLGAYGNTKANLYFGAGYSGPSMYIPNSEANVYAVNSFRAPAFYETSDIRIKTIIEDDSRVHGIELIKPKLYEKNGKKEFGYIAQDFLEVMPYSVTENSDGFYGLAYREVHSAKIAYLEDSIEEIKAKILYLENQLKNKNNENN